jgi:MFS family permease
MSIETLFMRRSSDQRSPGSNLPLSTISLVSAGFVALAVAMGIGRFAFTPVLPMMRHEGTLSITGAAWLASANYAGYLAGALLAWLVSIPTHRGIRWGLVIICLGTIAMGFVQTLSGWMVLRAVTGIGSAWVLIFISAWCLDHLQHVGRLVLNGAIFAGVGAGILLTGLFCLGFMKAKMTSTQAWIGLGSLAILSTVLIWPATRTIPKSERKLPGARTWNWEASRLILCYGAFGFSYIIPATFLPAMAQRIVADPGVFGWMWPAFGAAAIVSTLVAAVMSKRMGNRQLWIASQLLMAVGVALPALWHHLSSILVASILVGSTFMVISMAAVQEARQVAGHNPTPLISAMTTSFAIGQVIGPLLASKLPHLGGEFAGSLLLASFTLLLSACTLIRRGTAPLSKSPQNNSFGLSSGPIPPHLHSHLDRTNVAEICS